MKLVNIPSPGEARRAFEGAVSLGPPGPVPYYDFSFSRNHLCVIVKPSIVTLAPPPTSMTLPRRAALTVTQDGSPDSLLRTRSVKVERSLGRRFDLRLTSQRHAPIGVRSLAALRSQRRHLGMMR